MRAWELLSFETAGPSLTIEGMFRDQVRFLGSFWDVSQKKLKVIYLIKFDICYLGPF